MSLFIENGLVVEAVPAPGEVAPPMLDPEKRRKSKRHLIDGLANFLLTKTHSLSAYNDRKDREYNTFLRGIIDIINRRPSVAEPKKNSLRPTSMKYLKRGAPSMLEE